MKKFEYLEHTADVKIKAYGNNLEETFTNVALGMFNHLTDIEKVKPVIKHELNIKAKRVKSLLYDFLEDLLILLDTDGFILNKIEKISIKEEGEEFILHAICYGDSYKNYDVNGNIKSITYNDMEITDKEIIVVVDV